MGGAMGLRPQAVLGVAVLTVSVVAVCIWAPTMWDAAMASLGAEASAPAARAHAAAARAADAPSAADVPTRAAASLPDFVSVDNDGQPIANPVRDGLVVALRHADGSPCAQCPVVVWWRKGFGQYGHDRGATDADGRFATTVHEIPFVESVEAQHPVFGALQNGVTPVAAADDPRRVDYIVPAMADLRLVVRDLAGAPVVRASVAAVPVPEPVGVRATMLTPRIPAADADDAPRSGDDGVLTMRLPVGVCELAARIAEGKPAQTVQVRVPAGGGEVALLALAPTARIPVAVTVDMPADVERIDWLSAWDRSPLPPPTSPLVFGYEDEQRNYELVPIARGSFEARVDVLPWQLSLKTRGGLVGGAAVAAGQRAVHLTLAPPPADPAAAAIATLRVEVLDSAGAPATAAKVRVHEEAKLVHGSDDPVERDGRAVLRRKATGRRVCVSARAAGTPWTISEPLALDAGEHLVTLRLLPGGMVRGRVVDADGRPLAANVSLRRPASGLRELGVGVDDVLADPASGDTVGTGEPGEFNFQGVGPGEHEVWAHPADGSLPARVRVRAGDDVTLRPGQGCEDAFLLAFDAVDAATGAPVPLTHLSVQGALSGPLRADEGARFGPAAVRAGEVTVGARAIGYAEYEQRGVVGPAATRWEIRLQPSPLRFVRVRDGRGAPVWPAEVSARAEDGGEISWVDANGHWSGRSLRTDRGGCVTLRGLPLRAHTLVVARGSRGDGARREFALTATDGVDARLELVWPE
jgi:hypothetical protein